MVDVTDGRPAVLYLSVVSRKERSLRPTSEETTDRVARYGGNSASVEVCTWRPTCRTLWPGGGSVCLRLAGWGWGWGLYGRLELQAGS